MIILKESFNSSDIVVKITKCGRAIRNELSSIRDGERPYSGSYTGVFSGYSNVNTILPTDFNYTLSQVLDKKVGDAYGDLEFEVEVKQNLITEV